MATEETWRDQLVALGFVTDARKYDDFLVEQNISNWEDVLKLLAERESRKDTEAAKIITALLSLLDAEYEKVSDADGRALEMQKLSGEKSEKLTAANHDYTMLELDLEQVRGELKRKEHLIEEQRQRIVSLQSQRPTEQSAARVGHQVGAFIDAGRKVIRVSELDLPDEWTGGEL